MADPLIAPNPELAIVIGPGPKRKRMSHSTEERRSKRGAPAAAMSASPGMVTAAFLEHDVLDHGALSHGTLDHGTINHGVLDNSVVDQAVIDQSLVHDSVLDPAAIDPAVVKVANMDVTVADFDALQQAAAEHADQSANAAAAALGSMYPALHMQHHGGPEYDDQVDIKESNYPPPPDMDHHDDSMLQSHSLDPVTQQTFVEIQPHEAKIRIGPKPVVGTEEWHKLRKDNHKEVERRRRETINEGITELSKIVPGCEKNKGSILQQTVAFIVQIKDREHKVEEKYTLEKLLTDQALTEITLANQKLKQECERLYRELERWKHIASGAGLHPPIYKEEYLESYPPQLDHDDTPTLEDAM